MIIAGNIFGFIFAGIFFRKLFALTDLSGVSVLLMVIFGFGAESVFRNLTILVENIQILYVKNKERKNKTE